MNTNQKRIPIFEFGESEIGAGNSQVEDQFETDHPAAIPKLPLPTQTMKMNNTTCERGSTESQRPFSARRTLHHVTFFCDTPGAESVTLVGDFNGWNPVVTPMRRTPDGRWTASLELHHGHHRYLFLVDGTPTLDPNANGIVRNDRDERVSLIAVS